MMRAAVVEEIGQPLVVQDVPDPECPPDGAILRVAANGICRTDWHLWKGDWAFRGLEITLPFVLGHEFAGTIEQVGRNVRDWRLGDRVTFPMNPGEGTCEWCRSGNQQVCASSELLVPGVAYGGAFGEYVAVRHADVNLVRLPEQLSFTDAASMGCRYICAFHGLVDQVDVRGGEWVAVYGACGGIGLSAVQVATALGANVIAVDIKADQLPTVKELGAVHTIDASHTDPVVAVHELTNGGAQVSVDALGTAETCLNSVRSLRKLGRHLQLGHTTTAESGMVALPIDDILLKELRLYGAFGMQGHRYRPMLDMIDAGRLEPGRVVSRRVGLEEVTGVLQAMETFDTLGVVVIDKY